MRYITVWFRWRSGAFSIKRDSVDGCRARKQRLVDLGSFNFSDIVKPVRSYPPYPLLMFVETQMAKRIPFLHAHLETCNTN